MAPVHYDAGFTPQLLVTAIAEERRIRRLRAEKMPKTDSLAEHRAYYYAAVYDTPSKAVYTAIRDIVYSESSATNVSVFNVPPGIYSQQWTVVVIGDRPAEHVHQRIMDTLQGGKSTLIPYDLLMHLFERKLEANKKGGWQESRRTVVVKRKSKQKYTKQKRDRRHQRKKGK